MWQSFKEHIQEILPIQNLYALVKSISADLLKSADVKGFLVNNLQKEIIANYTFLHKQISKGKKKKKGVLASDHSKVNCEPKTLEGFKNT